MSVVWEEMLVQGVKLVGALLAGIGTVSISTVKCEMESNITELPGICEKLQEELNRVLNLIS